MPIDQEIVGPALISTQIFARTFLPGRFYRPFSRQVREEFFPKIDFTSKRYTEAVCHRGLGKTSIASVALPLRHICAGTKKCIVMISASATKAMQEMESIKYEIETNQLILDTFGDLRDKDNWTKESIVANDCFVLPRGPGQQIRGFNFRGRRPDLIVIDDLEDPEYVRNEEQRKKLKDWFLSDVLGSVDRGSDDYQILVVGTILHMDSLIKNIQDKEQFPEFEVINIPLCTEDIESLWPEFMSTEKVRELYESFKLKGKLELFAREYMNKCMTSEDASFKSEYFQQMTEQEWRESTKGKHVAYFTLADPAKTVNKKSAESAVVTWGIDKQTHRWWIADVCGEKFHPDEMMNEAFRQVRTWGSGHLGVEVTSLNEYITQPWNNELRRLRLPVTLVELKARDKKENRIAALVPHYRNKYIYHNPACCTKLEMQLLEFPYGKLVDIIDAAAYIIEMSELQQEYFENWDDIDYPTEEEYADIHNDPTPSYYGVDLAVPRYI